jgi:hypothetical protein
MAPLPGRFCCGAIVTTAEGEYLWLYFFDLTLTDSCLKNQQCDSFEFLTHNKTQKSMMLLIASI